MRGMTLVNLVVFVVGILNTCSGTNDSIFICSSAELSPCWFPQDFLFGTASSSYQYEGAHNVDGKGQSIWDTYMHEHPDRITDHSNGDVASDHYHRYKEDITLMKEMGMDAFRVSISWPRVLPNGRISGVISQKGLTHYNNVINEIINQGMKPFVTIFHWDVPQHLEFEYAGFRDKRIVQDFQDYAELLFDTYGDRVKHWITINEPSIFTIQGYDEGVKAPGRCSKNAGNCTYGDSGTEPYIVAHNLLLAHAAAVDVYKKKYQAQQKGLIGITLECNWMVPYSNRSEDFEAQQRALDFNLGWFLEPLTNGYYPSTMKKYVGDRLPKFKLDEQEKVKGSMDFLGLNYYTANYVANGTDTVGGQPSYSTDSMVRQSTERNGIPIGEPTGAEWQFVYPEGLKNLLVYIKRRYRNPVIYITENGAAEKRNPSSSIEEAQKDTQRKEYYCSHLYYLQKAINEEGVNVHGYFAWTLLDVFEWNFGYTNLFGIVYVDFQNDLHRYMKDSALWFKEFLKPHMCSRKVRVPVDSKEP